MARHTGYGIRLLRFVLTRTFISHETDFFAGTAFEPLREAGGLNRLAAGRRIYRARARRRPA